MAQSSVKAMSDVSKAEILADFQACSGIEDFEEAMAILSSCNWDLTLSLNKIFQEDDIATTPRIVNEPHRPTPVYSIPQRNQVAEMIDLVESSEDISPVIEFPASVPSTSSSGRQSSSHSSFNATPAVMEVNIKMLCGGASEDSSFPLEIPGSSTVGELQTMLHQLVGINPCSQVLEGFKKSVTSDTVITPELLPASKTLTLNVGSSNYIFNKLNNSPNDSYRLLIHDEKNKKDYSLNYKGTRSVRSIKEDMHGLSNVAVRHQKWTGWPSGCGDNTTLIESGIGKEHHFSMSSTERLVRTPKTNRKVIVDGHQSQEDSSNDEFEDACCDIPDEDFLDMTDVPSTQRSLSLIPPNVDDELQGVLSFVEEFKSRFGTACTPNFYQDTLENAMKQSLLLPARSRKLLAVYLHHGGSVLSNVFCSQALCHTSVVDYLSANFIVWGWDLTHESNKAQLLNIVSNHLGSLAPATIRDLSVEKLPVLLLITRNRGTNEFISVIHGNSVLDEVMTSLLHSTEIFEETRVAEVAEEDAREVREKEKAEQDAAYHVSLETDRKKEEARRIAELEVKEERERKESLRIQTEQLKEAVRVSLESDLEPEPPADCGEPITLLKFRVPNANHPPPRRFRMADTLQTVLNYLCIKGFPSDEYRVFLFPKKDITDIKPSQHLSDIGFHKQEALTVECRDMGDE